MGNTNSSTLLSSPPFPPMVGMNQDRLPPNLKVIEEGFTAVLGQMERGHQHLLAGSQDVATQTQTIATTVERLHFDMDKKLELIDERLCAIESILREIQQAEARSSDSKGETIHLTPSSSSSGGSMELPYGRR